jgi:DNA-binding response OmpR family regulator
MMCQRVLLVDDEPVLLNCLSLYIEDAGYQPLTALDAMAAFEVMQAEQPDVIVCDLRLPEIDGLRFRQKVRQHPKWQSIPFIMLTGFSEDSGFYPTLELGGERCLTKPFEPEDLLTAIAESLQDGDGEACHPAALG